MNTKKDLDKSFVRGLFWLIAFLLGTGVVGYALYTHNWSLIIGEVCGGLCVAIGGALKNTAPQTNKQ